jgi:hypothetical protein
MEEDSHVVLVVCCVESGDIEAAITHTVSKLSSIQSWPPVVWYLYLLSIDGSCDVPRLVCSKHRAKERENDKQKGECRPSRYRGNHGCQMDYGEDGGQVSIRCRVSSAWLPTSGLGCQADHRNAQK